MEACEAEDVFEVKNEGPEIPFPYAVRNPNAMVIEQLYAPIASGAVIDLIVRSKRLASPTYLAISHPFAAVALSFDSTRISNHGLVVAPVRHRAT